MEAQQEVCFEETDTLWLRQIFGQRNGEAAVQEVGSVLCREGRLLTFPNILQHRVLPFKRADPTKPGHRKILALFLVDPRMKIISTANVPPQQRDWWAEVVLKEANETGQGLSKLSTELTDMVFEAVDDFPIGLEEAKKIRLELMKERSQYVTTQQNVFEQHSFDLCEH
jgi:hypothetical protein